MRINANALNEDVSTSPRLDRTYMAGESVHASVHDIQAWDIGAHAEGLLRTEPTDTARTIASNGSIVVNVGDVRLYFATPDALRALADYATAAADAAEEVLDR
jgi:hypothetical protein